MCIALHCHIVFPSAFCSEPVNDTHQQCATCPNSYCNKHFSAANQNRSKEITSINFLCPPCFALEQRDRTSDRRGFLQVLQRVLRGQETSIPIDVIMSWCYERGGLDRIIENGEWQEAWKELGMNKMRRTEN